MTDAPILVVDDNPTNLKLIKVLLTKRGFSICLAHNAQEALTQLENARPRLILMDMQMPGIDGFTLVRQLKADPDMCSIPIIAVTAYAMKGDEQRTRDAGCDGYVAKPIDVNIFMRAIDDLL